MLKLYMRAQVLLQSLKDESGQDLIEYCIVAAVVVAAAVVATPSLQAAITADTAKLTAAIAAVP